MISPPTHSMSEQSPITIRQFPIRLGQFLKLANLVQDGLEAKIRIAEGEVAVNGEVETRRGRQLAAGDTVSLAGKDYRLAPP